MTWLWFVSPVGRFRREGVVPLAVEVVSGEGQGLDLGLGDLDAERVVAVVELGVDLQPGAGRGRPDEVDYDFVADQQSFTPVRDDRGEQLTATYFNVWPLSSTSIT